MYRFLPQFSSTIISVCCYTKNACAHSHTRRLILDQPKSFIRKTIKFYWHTHTQYNRIKVELCVLRPIVYSSREKKDKQTIHYNHIETILNLSVCLCYTHIRPFVSVLSTIKSNLRHIVGDLFFRTREADSTTHSNVFNSFVWSSYREAQKKEKPFWADFGHFQGRHPYAHRPDVPLSCKQWNIKPGAETSRS